MQGQAAKAFTNCEEVLTEAKLPFARQRNRRGTTNKHHQANLKPKVTYPSARQKGERLPRHKTNRRGEHTETIGASPD